VRLLGDDHAGDLASTAAHAYETSGVWTHADSVSGDLVDAIIDAALRSDLVMLGVSDDWEENAASVDQLRELVTSRIATPMLVFRGFEAEPSTPEPAAADSNGAESEQVSASETTAGTEVSESS
jgi:hypothetical protein